MSQLRTFEINYTKNGERKSFIAQVGHFYEDDEWSLVAQKFKIPLKDKHPDDNDLQTFKSLCIGAGYTKVTFIEQP